MGKCLGYQSPNIKISVSSQSGHSTFVLSTIDIHICMAQNLNSETESDVLAVTRWQQWHEY